MKGNYRNISKLCSKDQHINHGEDGKFGGKVKQNEENKHGNQRMEKLRKQL